MSASQHFTRRSDVFPCTQSPVIVTEQSKALPVITAESGLSGRSRRRVAFKPVRPAKRNRCENTARLELYSAQL